MQLNEQQLQEINDNIEKLIQQETAAIEPKRSLCRFFLRGLCIKSANNCKFSHGVQDLNYKPWTEDEVIEYEYLKDTDFTQKRTIKGPRIYRNLYEQQTDKIFTLAELNEDRAKRTLIRQEMHRRLFNQFMDLLQYHHPDGKFTQDFLVRQYTRAGFNKLMTKISFSQLSSHLCNGENPEWFKLTLTMPPSVKKERSYILRKASDHQTDKFYKETYHRIVKEHEEETIDEGKIKKHLFNSTRSSIHIPPLNVHLKIKKLNFPLYLRSIVGENITELQVKFEADLPTLLQSAEKFLQKNITERLVEWNDVYKHLAKEHQLNNGNVLNQVRPLLVLKGYRFLFFPMTQFITHPNMPLKGSINKENKNSDSKEGFNFQTYLQCPCNFKEPFPQEQLFLLKESLLEQNYKQLPHKQSYDIYDLESLLLCASNILKSKVLGIDLQGRLRKNGYIEMIQLNNGANTFLIDIYRMDLNGDVEAFELTKKVLRNVLVDRDILKIFHDCRHDSLALHEFMNCCVRNIYDTSATQTYKGQLEAYWQNEKVLFEDVSVSNSEKNVIIDEKASEKKRKLKQQKAKEILAQVNNVKTPGLNEILKTYHAPHGINKNKDLFHGMWKKGQTSLFDERPLNPEYREYCIKDVLDLPHVYEEMTSSKQIEVLGFDLRLAKWVSGQYVKNGYLGTEQGEEKK